LDSKAKRNEQHRLKKNRQPNNNYPSIRTANLHPKYPLHLRSMSHFVKGKGPKIDERSVVQILTDMNEKVQRLIDYFDEKERKRVNEVIESPVPTSHSTGSPSGWTGSQPHPQRKRSRSLPKR
jgi:hypothetical protein